MLDGVRASPRDKDALADIMVPFRLSRESEHIR